MAKLKLETTDLTEADLEDFDEEEYEESSYSKKTKALIAFLILIAICSLAIIGFCVGVIIKDMITEPESPDEVLGVITIEDENNTSVTYTTSEDTCVFIFKFSTPGAYTCVVTVQDGNNKSVRKAQSYLVKDITDDYTLVLNNYDATTDYTVAVKKSATGNKAGEQTEE